MTILAIEIGGTKLQLVVGDELGRIADRRRYAVDRAQGGAGIRERIKAAIPELQSLHRIEAVGVGFGGPIDWRTGRVCRSHHIEGWTDFELAGWLRGLTGTPVITDNDANVAALGEALAGAGVGCDPVFYATLGSGIGGGLVAGGRIYHGATPGEAEIGHIRLDRAGTILESRCSGWSVDARVRAEATAAPDGVLAQLAGKVHGGEARHLGPALAQGDATAQRIVQEVASDFAMALSHVVQLFHPAVVILGGGLTKLGEPLREAIDRELRRGLVMRVFAPGPPIRLSALGEDVVPIGALKLAALGAA